MQSKGGSFFQTGLQICLYSVRITDAQKGNDNQINGIRLTSAFKGRCDEMQTNDGYDPLHDICSANTILVAVTTISNVRYHTWTDGGTQVVPHFTQLT